MSAIDKLVRIWRNDIPPPQNKPFLYNAFVVLGIEKINLGGEVRWDNTVKQYVFQPAEATSEKTYKTYEITVPSYYYLEFRNIIRTELGVYVTRGIHDDQSPPETQSKQLRQIHQMLVPQKI